MVHVQHEYPTITSIIVIYAYIQHYSSTESIQYHVLQSTHTYTLNLATCMSSSQQIRIATKQGQNHYILRMDLFRRSPWGFNSPENLPPRSLQFSALIEACGVLMYTTHRKLLEITDTKQHSAWTRTGKDSTHSNPSNLGSPSFS